MKKIFVRIIVLLSILLLSACSKIPYSLSGTTWTGADKGAIYKLTFSADEFTLMEEVSNEFVTGDYVYEPPTITFVFKKLTEPSGKVWTGGGTFTGRVEGKTMILTIGEASATFIRK